MGVFAGRMGAARLAMTTRGGVSSRVPYHGFNVSAATGDDPGAVERNRAWLARVLRATEVVWLDQVHGPDCVDTDRGPCRRADAAVTRKPGKALAIMVADCLPVLITDRDGRQVGAAHAGWRGLAAGVLNELVAAMDAPRGDLHAWLGPRIEAGAYEVDETVYAAFDGLSRDAFRHSRPGHWWLDLARAAELQLAALGVRRIRDCGIGVYADRRFFSYRRDGLTGRNAVLIMPAAN